jgi:hypothetical protein
MLRAALSLALLVAALRTAAAEAPAAAPPDPGTFESPPAAATREDAALWRRAADVNVDVPVQRSVSTRLQAEVNGSLWRERLAEGVRRGRLSGARAAELERRLVDGWNALALILSAGWPVDPTRVCGYPWLDFDSTLQTEDPAFRSEELPQARARLQQCVEKATAALASLRHANHEYREAFQAIVRETPEVPPIGAAPAAAAR